MTVREVYSFGNYENVELTREEYNQLNQDYSFNDIRDYIERLDAHIQSTSKKYPNHNLTLREWLQKDKVPTLTPVAASKTSSIPYKPFDRRTEEEKQRDQYLEDHIYEIIRREYHENKCPKCGIRLQFIKFTKPGIDGIITDAQYECTNCGLIVDETFIDNKRQPLKITKHEK